MVTIQVYYPRLMLFNRNAYAKASAKAQRVLRNGNAYAIALAKEQKTCLTADRWINTLRPLR